MPGLVCRIGLLGSSTSVFRLHESGPSGNAGTSDNGLRAGETFDEESGEAGYVDDGDCLCGTPVSVGGH